MNVSLAHTRSRWRRRHWHSYLTWTHNVLQALPFYLALSLLLSLSLSQHSALVLFAFQQVAERDHNIISSSAPAGHANILSRHKNCRKRVPRVAAFLSPLPSSPLLFQVNAHRCAACSCYPSPSPLAHVELNSQWPRNEFT